MSVPILTTKLYIPSLPSKVILRPRLMERMDEGLQRKLILISASAGFGKTTVVSQWITSCRQPVAWLSLDSEHEDPMRFLVYLIAALQTIAPDFGEAVLSMLQSPQPLPMESILTNLVNEITTITEDFILVLDDYHILDSKRVDQILGFLLEHQPPMMHMVIATREDPNLPLARMRARGQLAELRISDLRFTPFEASEFLNQILNISLSMEYIIALDKRTEGWIAGLQLAAISMEGQKDLPGFIKSFTGSHRFVTDYLLEEVLHKQSETIHSFLLQTSILDRLCGHLCDSLLLSPSGSGQKMLESLEQANLFIIPLDNERRWYRYHHLFADLLNQRLKQKGILPELHVRASLWYEENGFIEEAIHHAISSGNFKRTADLVEIAWPQMNISFQSSRWLAWAKVIPEEIVRSRPVLCVDYGWALLDTGNLEDCESRLQDGEKWLGKRKEELVIVDKEQYQTLPFSISSARAYLHQALGDIKKALKYAQQTMNLVTEGDHYRYWMAATTLAVAYWANGDLEAAYNAFSSGMDSIKKTSIILFEIASVVVLAEIRVAQGFLKEAIRIYENSLFSAGEHGRKILWVTANHHLGLTMIHIEQGHMEIAEKHLLKSRELSGFGALGNWPYLYHLAQARIKEVQGDLKGALELLYEAERLYFENPTPEIHPIGALQTRLLLKQDRLIEAQTWIHKQGISIDDELGYLQEFEHITLARILMAENNISDDNHLLYKALGLLDRLLKAAEERNSMASVIEIRVLQAIAHQTGGNITLALQSLECALALAEPENYFRIFVDEGLPMASLLSETAAKGKMTPYIAKLMSFFKEKDEKIKLEQPLIEPLSLRELEVLKLIAQGLSNNQISERLFLALSTVKGHNRIIFSKLQVQRRTEAVAKGKELGLI